MVAAPIQLRCGLKAYLPLCVDHVTFQDTNIQVCTGYDPAKPVLMRSIKPLPPSLIHLLSILLRRITITSFIDLHVHPHSTYWHQAQCNLSLV